MYEISATLANQYLEARKKYDAYQLAYAKMKESGMKEDCLIMNELASNKQVSLHDCNDARSSIIKASPKGDNIVKLNNLWYGVKYSPNKGTVVLAVEPMRECNLSVLQREGTRALNLSSSDIALHLPLVINEEEANNYQKKVEELAEEICASLNWKPPVYESKESAVGSPVKVSAHAVQRWILRKLGIKGDRNINDYALKNARELIDSILSGYMSAEFMCCGIDGMEFWIDADNTVYAVGYREGYPTIVTLYEADFGWDKQANRWLVNNQMLLINSTRENYDAVLREHEQIVSNINADIAEYDSEIQELLDKIDMIRAKKQVKASLLDESQKVIKHAKSAYEVQFNKIFKRWEDNVQ